jgi:hypothetical protein
LVEPGEEFLEAGEEEYSFFRGEGVGVAGFEVIFGEGAG